MNVFAVFVTFIVLVIAITIGYNQNRMIRYSIRREDEEILDIICAMSGITDLERPKKGILTIKEGGFTNILLDLAMSCPAHELENIEENLGKPDKNKAKLEKEWKKRQNHQQRISISKYPEKLLESIVPILTQCQAQQIHIPIAHAPYLSRNTKRGDLAGLLSKLAKESIRVCGQAGCRMLIIQPVFAGVPHGMEWEINRKYYLALADTAKQNDVTILLENQCRDINGHLVRGICADAFEAAAWIDKLNEEVGEERFGFCMDVGACTLCSQGMQEFVLTLDSRIKAVILRDCDGQHETSMLPFTCVNCGQSQTDWQGLICGLREICFDGALVMDFSSTINAFSHLFRPQLLQLAKATADYFKWQINIKSVLRKYDKRVLFGAGNMCRNYMKCYGEEFPPFFTCDNDKNRWGEWFEELEIKPPESLKELEPDCAIFICNIYYKEIEEQLRRMGIRNPIEHFNDEYMPSYYPDKLELWKGEE